ncbi:MAG: putative quinol monooxygenase [Kiloniellales bacterium]
MYVIVADFTIDPDRMSEFRDAILTNARQSVEQEPGCRQFDVCIDPERDDRIYLYEVYDDEAAFKAHLETKHFHEFDTGVQDWVRTREVTALHRLFPSG